MKRRKFISDSSLAAFSVSAFGSIRWNGKHFVADKITTSDILGPFYRPGAPLRSNLVPPDSKAEVMNLTGTVYKSDGTTPLPDVLIEAWQCSEDEIYDNTSDAYLYRGAVKSDRNGQYSFRTIVPVPYKDGDGWRPAHIHMRISSSNQQDLITQIYFKGDPHLQDDTASASPQSAQRILDIRKNAKNENEVKFDIVLGESYTLSEEGYRKICGLYELNKGTAEFYRQDDLLFLKLNGWIMEGLSYKGNNLFEGGMGFNKVKFEITEDGSVLVSITMWDNWSENNQFLEKYEGKKVLKY